MDHLTTALAAVLLACVCVTSLPVNGGSEITKLEHLIGKLRSLSRKRLDSDNWAHFKSTSVGNNKPELSNLEDSKNAPEEELAPSLTDDMAVRKRQGAWSYDYGLGGGRFGKRNYGDYGIGGGRFGRDVDHVDLAD